MTRTNVYFLSLAPRSELLTDLGLATTERPRGSAARRHRPLTNFDLLEPGGVFANLEHVASPSHRLHPALLASIREPLKDEGSSDRPLDVKSQHGCAHALSTTSTAPGGGSR
jgi:hypothetical protein